MKRVWRKPDKGEGFSATNNTVQFKLTSLPVVKDTTNKNMLASVFESVMNFFGIGSSATTATTVLDPNNPIIYTLKDIPSLDTKTLDFIVPADIILGTYDLTVSADDSKYSDPLTVTVVSTSTVIDEPLSLTSISPTSGIVGSAATITGTGFASSSIIKFGSYGTTTPSSLSTTTLIFTVPSVATGTYSLFVQNSDGQVSTSTNFTVTIPVVTPTETVIYNSGAVNTPIPINGGSSIWKITTKDIPSGRKVLGAKVSMRVDGGYNGMLYMYLTAPNTQLRNFINQPGMKIDGFGQYGRGIDVILSDTALTNINDQTGDGILKGSFKPGTPFGTWGMTYSKEANGTWVLFFATMASGGGQSYIKNWTITLITDGPLTNTAGTTITSTSATTTTVVPAGSTTPVIPQTVVNTPPVNNPAIVTGTNTIPPECTTVPQNTLACQLPEASSSIQGLISTKLYTSCPTPTALTSICSFECADTFTLRGGQCVSASETY